MIGWRSKYLSNYFRLYSFEKYFLLEHWRDEEAKEILRKFNNLHFESLLQPYFTTMINFVRFFPVDDSKVTNQINPSLPSPKYEEQLRLIAVVRHLAEVSYVSPWQLVVSQSPRTKNVQSSPKESRRPHAWNFQKKTNFATRVILLPLSNWNDVLTELHRCPLKSLGGLMTTVF